MFYDVGRTSATVEVRCKHHDSISELQYSFDGGKLFDTKNTETLDSSQTTPLKIVVADASNVNTKITLEELDFVWNAPEIQQSENYKNG